MKCDSQEKLVQEIAALRREIDDLKTTAVDSVFYEQFNAILESGLQVVLYVIQDGKFQFVNDHAAEYWGYSKRALVGMETMNFVHPNDRERVREKAIETLKGRRSSSYEFRTTEKGGAARWMTETVAPIEYKGKRALLGIAVDITEQTRARLKLTELEALEASLLRAMPHAVIGLRDRRIVFANEGVQSVFGWRVEELIGKRTRVFYRSDNDNEKMAAQLYARLEHEQTFGTEFPCRHKDGTDIYCMVHASRIGESLRERNIVITYEDITDRKRADEAYKLMARSSVAGVYIVKDGKFRYVNNFAAHYAGCSEEELVGVNASSLVHPADREMVRKNATKMLKGKGSTPYEFRIITKKGDMRWIMEAVTLIPFEGRRAILGNSMDITELIETRNKVAELKALETSFLEAIPHAVVGLRERKIIFANEGAETVFGWRADELIGQSTRMLYRTEKDYKEVARRLYSTMRKQSTFRAEFPCRRKDGQNIECLISAARIGESLKRRYIVVTYEDITESKQSQIELEKSREQLRNLSAHLESAREKERTRIARELHDELGQLLTALHMDIALLNKKIPRDQELLLKKTESMTKLIDMTMNTLKRIYMDLRPGMLDHLGLAVAIGWQAGEFEKRTGIACKVTVDPEDLEIDPDLSTAVFRIFQETLTNISRHSEATRAHVSLKLKNNRVELTVKDNGKGITEDQLTKPKSFGLIGIGERAYHWNGKVKITGKKGKGTTVRVDIPLQGKGDK